MQTKRNPEDLGSRDCQLKNFQVSGGTALRGWKIARIGQNNQL